MSFLQSTYLLGEMISSIIQHWIAKKTEIRRSFRGFLEGYHPERGYVINKNLNQEMLVGKTMVKCLPYWELLLEDPFP